MGEGEKEDWHCLGREQNGNSRVLGVPSFVYLTGLWGVPFLGSRTCHLLTWKEVVLQHLCRALIGWRP